MIDNSFEISRRAFLRRSAQLSAAGAASAFALDLAALNEAAAFSNVQDYKALVCIFLGGGNDHANTLIPFDQENYLKYSKIRGGDGEAGGGVALSRQSLSQTVLRQPDSQILTDGISYALAPTMPKLAARFNEGKLGVVLNVGPLETPLTLSQYLSTNHKAYPRPKKLFSHSDQARAWHTSSSAVPGVGWGGRMADLAQSANTNAMFTAIGISGGMLLRGQESLPFHLSTKGALLPKGLQYKLYGSSDATGALSRLLLQNDGSPFQIDLTRTNSRSIDYNRFLAEVLANTEVNVTFPSGSSLGSQLSMVTRLIAARDRVGVRRQLFMVSLGGFDHHGGLRGSHEALLGEVDGCMDAFYRAMLGLGIADQVTTFTTSDFGRTLSVNGDGTDHGWGGHHFVLGGAVKGGRFYGTAPQVSLTSDDQVKRGRLLPKISVDEYAATLARWFGVADSELPSVLPNIGRFATRGLGFI